MTELVKRKGTLSNLEKADSMTDEELERIIAEDEDERYLQPDWPRVRLVNSHERPQAPCSHQRDKLREGSKDDKSRFSRQGVFKAMGS